jgi:hypothetical protein
MFDNPHRQVVLRKRSYCIPIVAFIFSSSAQKPLFGPWEIRAHAENFPLINDFQSLLTFCFDNISDISPDRYSPRNFLPFHHSFPLDDIHHPRDSQLWVTWLITVHQGCDRSHKCHHWGVIFGLFERDSRISLRENRGSEMSYVKMDDFDAKLGDFQVESFCEAWLESI